MRAPERGARLSRPFFRPEHWGLWLAAAPNASSAAQGQWRGGHYGPGEPSPATAGFAAARAARTRSRAPRWMPARAPIRGGRRCSPAWGDCAEPMALLAASARLHRRPAPRRPGGAPGPSSRRPRPSRRLARPPPRSRWGIQRAASGGKGSRAESGAAPATPVRRPAPERGAAGRGPASRAARGRGARGRAAWGSRGKLREESYPEGGRPAAGCSGISPSYCEQGREAAGRRWSAAGAGRQMGPESPLVPAGGPWRPSVGLCSPEPSRLPRRGAQVVLADLSRRNLAVRCRGQGLHITVGQKEEMNCGEAGGMKEGETESWRKPLKSELKTQTTLHLPVRGTS